MGHTNSTPNYGLPQFLGTDKPAWLSDVNQAYSDIDTGIYNAKAAADGAQLTADGAVGGVATANTRMDGIQNQLNTVDSQASTTAATVGTHTTQIGTLANSVNTINGRLGNTDISAIGDGTITGAIDAISQGGGGGGTGYHVVATSTGATVTAALDSLYSAVNGLTEEQKVSAKLAVYNTETGKISTVFQLLGTDGGYQFTSITATSATPYSYSVLLIVKQSGSKYYEGNTNGALVDQSTASFPATRSYKLLVL